MQTSRWEAAMASRTGRTWGTQPHLSSLEESGRVAGSTVCKECPVSSVTLGTGAKSFGECLCTPPQSLTMRAGKCEACPDGTACDVDGYDTRSLVLLPGWWRSSGESNQIRECPFGKAACPGSESFNHCTEGYRGPLCATCAESFYLDSSGDTCKSCDGISRNHRVFVPSLFVLVQRDIV